MKHKFWNNYKLGVKYDKTLYHRKRGTPYVVFFDLHRRNSYKKNDKKLLHILSKEAEHYKFRKIIKEDKYGCFYG